MESFRIAMVTDWFFGVGGIEKHVQNLAKCLSKSGHEVGVITNYINNGYKHKYDFEVYKIPGLPLKKWNVIVGIRPFFGLKKILKNYDIVHVHSIFSPLSSMAIFVANKKKPIILTNHSLIGNPPLGSLIRKTIEKPISKVNAIIAVSTAVKRETEQITAKPIFLIPNGIDANILNTAYLPKEKESKKNGKLTIISVARLTKRKQIIDLVDIAHELRDYDIKFIIIGDGPERKKICKKISELRLNNFELVGQKNEKEVINLMKNSDIFILPSMSEAFGIAALEARACGLPVIARNHSGVSDIIKHGKNGFLANSKEEMTSYLKELILRPELRKEFSVQARVGIENYTWDAVARKVTKAYKWVLENEKNSNNS